MNQHISRDLLMNYIYHTLNNDERAAIEAHLPTCSECRAQLSQHEQQQQHIRFSLKADIEAAQMPPQMSFAKIAPHLQQRPSSISFRAKLWQLFPVATAVIGLVLAFFGLSQTVSPPPHTNQPIWSTLACFCFAFISVGQSNRTPLIQFWLILKWALAVILWLGTAVIGLQNIAIIRNLVVEALIVTGHMSAISFITIITVLVATCMYIVVIIGGGEYHYRHLGEPGSWKLFSYTIIIQLFILLLPYFLL